MAPILRIAIKVTEEHDRTLQYKIPMKGGKDYKAAYVTDE
jgi:hypothetical protein